MPFSPSNNLRPRFVLFLSGAALQSYGPAVGRRVKTGRTGAPLI
ncbi:hypothetical protein HMPREF1548_05597 [Clostridium sp. KLE 1755]|nr:hypothetical protein HMPREF1548_05597 [Clostridium sp. KLE 1755]